MVQQRLLAIRPCFIITIVYFFIVLLYQKLSNLPEFNYYQKVESYTSKPFRENQKSILLWNKYFNVNNWGLSSSFLNETYFIDSNCSVTNCFITMDQGVIEVSDYDAIVFHTAESFPIFNSIPNIRTPKQLYVFATMESPAHTKHDLSDEINFYNITMSYRLDSDILWPYGYIEDIETGQLIAPCMQPIWRQPELEVFDLDEITDKLIAGKNKTAAWFVSHCDAISKRDDLVKALQKYMSVDVYGKCGTFSCPRSTDECNEKLNQEYKFYLAFENSLCNDYITEKVFDTLKRTVIPIVYGGANYTRFLPPHSYINAEDYGTVEDLAKYLTFLDENPNEYRKYFWWKRYYRRKNKSPFCELCAILNNPSKREKVQYYQDIQEWWYGHNCRMKTKIKL